MSVIKINGGAGWAKVWVEGVELHYLTGVSFAAEPGRMSEVSATMALMETDIEIADGVLKIAGLEMPETVEKALLEYLLAKHHSRKTMDPPPMRNHHFRTR